MHITRLSSYSLLNYKKTNRQYSSKNVTANIYKNSNADTISFSGQKALTIQEIDKLIPVKTDTFNIEINCPTNINLPPDSETIQSVYPFRSYGNRIINENSPYHFPNSRNVDFYDNGAVRHIDDYISDEKTIKNLYGDSWGDCKRLKRELDFDYKGRIQQMAINTGTKNYIYNYEGKLTYIEEYDRDYRYGGIAGRSPIRSIRVYAGTKDIAYISYSPSDHFSPIPLRRDFFDNGKIYKSVYKPAIDNGIHNSIGRKYYTADVTEAYTKEHKHDSALREELLKELRDLK